MEPGCFGSGPDQRCFEGVLTCLKLDGIIIAGRSFQCRALLRFNIIIMLIHELCCGKVARFGKVVANRTQQHPIQYFPQVLLAEMEKHS